MTTTLRPGESKHGPGPTEGEPTPVGSRAKWVFLSRSSLPADPTARRLEKRGRWWLALSYLLCPCHLPITLTLAGLAFGGTALGATIAGNAIWVGIALTFAYALVLWRGFRQLRRSKQALAAGESLQCSTSGCVIVPAAPTTSDLESAYAKAR